MTADVLGRGVKVCGFVGAVRLDGQPMSSPDLSSSLQELYPRGPDAQGTWTSPWAALGHTRLAVIDVDPRSNQPFADPTGRYMLVYNGEVYNYRELRTELAPEWSFRTTGDTEVVLAALVIWGTLAFSRFNGMWALALLDTIERRLLLSRDRFGVKPLHVANNQAETVFGSTIEALRPLLSGPLTPNLAHLSRYLVTAASHVDDSTFYQGVREVRPGTWESHDAGGKRRGTYWSLPVAEDGIDISPVEVGSLLDDAVRLRMRADVPVGVTLSAGLDSSLIATLMARSTTDVLAFTARFDGCDESGPAHDYAQTIGVPWQGVSIPDQLDPDFLQARIRELDGPNASPAANALWFIMKAIRSSGRVVVLEGQGADEVFGGYSSIVGPFWAREKLLAGDLPELRKCLAGLRHDMGTLAALQHSVRRLVPGAHHIYQRGIGTASCLQGDLRLPVEALTTPGMSTAEVLHRSVNDVLRSLLHYGDRMSLAHSVETRQPFLDYRLVEAVSRSDVSHRLAGGRGKDVLRVAGRDILRSSAPIRAPKQGFPVPTLQWVRDRHCQNLLIDGHLVGSGLIDRNRLIALLSGAVSGRSPMRTQSVYRMLTAELWWRAQGW